MYEISDYTLLASFRELHGTAGERAYSLPELYDKALNILLNRVETKRHCDRQRVARGVETKFAMLQKLCTSTKVIPALESMLEIVYVA